MDHRARQADSSFPGQFPEESGVALPTRNKYQYINYSHPEERGEDIQGNQLAMQAAVTTQSIISKINQAEAARNQGKSTVGEEERRLLIGQVQKELGFEDTGREHGEKLEWLQREVQREREKEARYEMERNLERERQIQNAMEEHFERERQLQEAMEQEMRQQVEQEREKHQRDTREKSQRLMDRVQQVRNNLELLKKEGERISPKKEKVVKTKVLFSKKKVMMQDDKLITVLKEKLSYLKFCPEKHGRKEARRLSSSSSEEDNESHTLVSRVQEDDFR